MLVYRSCRCCRRLWSKLLHTMFHFMAIPCIVIGFIAAWDYHALHPDKAIPHLYTIHSWMGLATMGLFLLQFVSGNSFDKDWKLVKQAQNSTRCNNI